MTMESRKIQFKGLPQTTSPIFSPFAFYYPWKADSKMTTPIDMKRTFPWVEEYKISGCHHHHHHHSPQQTHQTSTLLFLLIPTHLLQEELLRNPSSSKELLLKTN